MPYQRSSRVGFGLAVFSAATFGTSGGVPISTLVRCWNNDARTDLVHDLGDWASSKVNS